MEKPIIRSPPSSVSLPARARGFPPGLDYLHGGAAGRRAAANHALDAVPDHEVHGALAGADQGLVAFHRQVLGPGHQGNLLQVIAAIGHVRRDVVVLAVVGEGAFIEGLEDDLYLFLEQLPVGVPVQHGRVQGFDLAGVVAPAHAEDDPSVGEDVGGGIVLGQAQGVPHGGDVEAAANLESLGQVGQVDGEQQQVGDALVAFPLEVVLGHPEGIVVQPVHGLGNGLGLVERRGQTVIGQPAVVGRRGVQADVVKVNVPGKQAAKLGNHSGPSGVVQVWSRWVRAIIADLGRNGQGGLLV